MKILRSLSILFIAGFVLLSCQKDPDLRMPDVKTGFVAFLILDEASSDLIDITRPQDFSFIATIDQMYPDPFSKVTLTVVYNGDYTNQIVLEDNITSLPHEVNISIDDLIASIPELNSITDLEPGNQFKFLVEVVLQDGTVLPGATETGNSTYSAAVRNTVATVYGGTTEFAANVILVDRVAGLYDVHAISYSSPGEYDEDWLVLVQPVNPESNDGSYYFTGIAGTEGVIYGEIDVDAGTASIESGQTIGDAYGYGNIAVVNYSETGGPLTGVLNDADSSMVFDLWGHDIVSGTYAGYNWDVFETNWDKR